MNDRPTVGEWLRALEDLYPSAWAEEWDRVELHVRGNERPLVAVLARRPAEAGPPGEVLVSERSTDPFPAP